MRLPILFPAPRFYLQLLFVSVCALGLAALEIGRTSMAAAQRNIVSSSADFMGAVMQLRFSLIERCAVLLFGGYLLFFLLRHDPYPRAVPGLLAIALPGYMRSRRTIQPTCPC